MVKTVMVKPTMEASLWVRSRMGIMWPAAGNGITSTCGVFMLLLFGVTMAARGI